MQEEESSPNCSNEYEPWEYPGSTDNPNGKDEHLANKEKVEVGSEQVFLECNAEVDNYKDCQGKGGENPPGERCSGVNIQEEHEEAE